jgi:hypothetical protein
MPVFRINIDITLHLQGSRNASYFIQYIDNFIQTSSILSNTITFESNTASLVTTIQHSSQKKFDPIQMRGVAILDTNQ